jgi:hypothetical protein
MAPTFERLNRDPRPIDQDLRRVCLSRERREMLRLWQGLLDRFAVVPTQIQYRFCMFFVPPGIVPADHENRIYDHDSAERWLKLDYKAWMRYHPYRDRTGNIPTRERNIIIRAFRELYSEKKRMREESANLVRPAIGFWLFPIEVLNVEGDGPDRQRVFDFSVHWPELALSSLPYS